MQLAGVLEPFRALDMILKNDALITSLKRGLVGFERAVEVKLKELHGIQIR
ncbi:hypothetical protein KVK50_07635 [Helicobacter pylori]|nr:hypothetical protein KVK50_07635 [Helicobacter pylori]